MENNLTGQESIKRESLYLKGKIAEDIADLSQGGVSNESYELLKFHGTYEQFDRDKAEQNKKAAAAKGERAADNKEWSFMLRLKIAGGYCSAEQYLALDEIAELYAGSTLRITTRETIQLHGIIKKDLKPTIAAIDKMLLTTIGACGDIVRNVLCCPAPFVDKKHTRMRDDADAISAFTMPKTTAYHEIWVDGERFGRSEENENYEPLYGRTYLPRKFKIALAFAEDNCTDALTNDLAIFPIWQNETLLGYNFALGGGLGMTHNKPETYPRLASFIAFIPESELLRGVEAVVKLQRDHGDRTNLKHARLKYLVEEKGLDWIHSNLETYYGEKLEKARPMARLQIENHMGWHEQGDGKWFIGLPIISGRIRDSENAKIRSGLKHIVKTYSPTLHFTAEQHLLLGNISSSAKDLLTNDLRAYGILLHEDFSPSAERMLACVSLPTCGLALAEAERIQTPTTNLLDSALQKHGIAREPITLRISGCPNGCSRPYAAEIALVGRMPGHYSLFLGGKANGTALADKIFDRVPFADLENTLDKIIEIFVKQRAANEEFGEFCARIKTDSIKQQLVSSLENYKWAKA